MEDQAALKHKFKIFLMIYGAFISAIFFYTFLAYMISQSESMHFNQKSVEILLPVLSILSVSYLIIAPMIKGIILKKNIFPTLPNEEKLEKIFISELVGCAFYEAIAIQGVLLVFLSGKFFYALIFAGVSLICLVIRFPRIAEWETLMRLHR